MINFLVRISRLPRISQLQIFVVIICTLAVAATLASAWLLDGRLMILYGTLCILLCSNVVLFYISIQKFLREARRRRKEIERINESLEILSKNNDKLRENSEIVKARRDIKILHVELSSLTSEVHEIKARDEHLHSLTRKRVRSKFAAISAALSKESNNAVRHLQLNRADLQSMKHSHAEVMDNLQDMSDLLADQRDKDGFQALEIQAAFLEFLEELRPIGNIDKADTEGPAQA